MPIPLQDAPVQSTVRIVAIDGDPQATMRVRELGLTTGSVCRVIRRAPFGGPVEVAVGATHLGLRLNDILRILVEPHANGNN
jgi:Fe2+ transport system protein FeoA